MSTCNFAAPSDFSSVTDEVLRFDSNTLSQTVLVPIVNDSVFENPETFTSSLRLQVADRQVLVDPDVATVMITDDDGELLSIQT